ncbi:MAG: tryptophan--tRNA ligase [Gammaproteobacteria bacterium]|uniref:tryptophan--tRNA ligase n=1 Tax=Rhodoferax sp. TaxID=50421 RepID=UPI0017D3A29A|nr:tryptophan--tRNA ligase [Rhodoferax sp.]MBU3900347.1 tryptophan--tRNA ligase [Gammaproteobacteria bacterium]MBA3058465.1 tryptophan--tRNA ligase [Rhodoferax sp.]MBU3998014.1 tryptophan--tRNA ligase [Gammaproteobacteria bacterium]MBU4018934.1 tryptophan--tRNA ligase [Gammaproteobacteria bacterium]MBU4080924.1 tryptophan--tRNA ligase [Gammaproteobacteria bacterium]
MSSTRFLTGITTSGTPHLGNYVGSIRPSVRASLRSDVESFYFLADYHALIKIDKPERIQRSTLEIAASWLACGLDPERVVFYRQSDVPEIPELTWLLTCVIGKGVLNRAHAYKAAVDKNTAAGIDPESDVTAGLFMYPVLMGADILMFNAHKVPVGRDQVQHIEMARDMAHSFNHRYGDHFVPPEAEIEASVATLPGLDGRKMSKSYDNTIPLFSPRAQLKKLIASIVTDSRAPGEAKDTEGSALFQIYQAFATPDESAALRQGYADGISWADAKQIVFERIDDEIAPLREVYQALLDDPVRIESILRAGAAKARQIATPFMGRLRQAVGLRDLRTQSSKAAKSVKSALPLFKQYRESDGQFYFKFLDAQGRLLLQSAGFASPKVAGQAIGLLQAQGASALSELQDQLQWAPDVQSQDITGALQALVDAKIQ